MAEESIFGDFFTSPNEVRARRKSEFGSELSRSLADVGRPEEGPALFPGTGTFEGPPTGIKGLLDPSNTREIIQQMLESGDPDTIDKGRELAFEEIQRQGLSKQLDKVFDTSKTGLSKGVDRIKGELRGLARIPETTEVATQQLRALQSGIAKSEADKKPERFGNELESASRASFDQGFINLSPKQRTVVRNQLKEDKADKNPAKFFGDNIELEALAEFNKPFINLSASQKRTVRDNLKTAGEDDFKVELRRNKALDRSNSILSGISKAFDQIGFFSTGFIGNMSSIIANSPGFNLEQTLKVVTSNVAFKALEDMKAASKTGGALGQIAVRELELLEATMGSMRIGQSEDQLVANLRDIQQRFVKVQNLLAREGDVLTTASGQRVKVIKRSPDGDHDVELVQ